MPGTRHGPEKEKVRTFWERAACGEELFLPGMTRKDFDAQAAERYRLEPHLQAFASFEDASGLEVLEVGLGLGADHEAFARAGARLHGIDLTRRAASITRHRLRLNHFPSKICVGDAEVLPYPDASFDRVYSWGVIHHTPDTRRAAQEILRVLRPGGELRVMVYHKWSLVGLMLWLRYGLGRGRPFLSLKTLYATYLESPGTQAFTREEARCLFRGATGVTVGVELTHGDLLESEVGQRHRGPALAIARYLWPRWLLRRFAGTLGLHLLVHGHKPRLSPSHRGSRKLSILERAE